MAKNKSKKITKKMNTSMMFGPGPTPCQHCGQIVHLTAVTNKVFCNYCTTSLGFK